MTVTSSEAGPAALDIYLIGYGSAGISTKQVLRVPGPVTAGQALTVTGTAYAATISCTVTGVVVTS